MQKKGQLGCFGLTEKLAGVNSGLVVQTTATWDKQQQSFILDSPTEGSQKNWISQGLVAEKAAVIADLRVDGKSYGPHAFLIDMRSDDGTLLPGVVLGDMGVKTTGNDLDNAWIKFEKKVLPRSALLNRFADIQGDKYVQTTSERMRIEVIGQRLLTGRIAVSQAALQFARNLFAQTRAYTGKKDCWAPGGEIKLGSIGHIRALFEEAERSLSVMENYTRLVEAELSKCLVANSIPSPSLVEAIAVAKIASVEHAISLTFRLKMEVGSYALMGGTGFGDTDFLLCCKFAEGDSRILMQKLARDQVKSLATLMKAGKSIPTNREKEVRLCDALQKVSKTGWDDAWPTVYELANLVIDRTIKEWTGGQGVQRSFI